MPRVSINLCCYNSEPYLEETLQGIFRQTYKDWELVIVNDGSTDSTEKIIRRYIEQGWPIVYHYQTNAGLGKARNKAIEFSNGEFVALIDHDDLWETEKLEKQLALFAVRPQAGVVYSDAAALFPDGCTQVYTTHVQIYRGWVLTQLVLSNFVACSSIVLRRAVLDKVGFFNPDFVQVEEYDLLIRIAEHYQFDYVDQPLMKYRLHQQNAGWDGSRMQAETIMLMRQVMERNTHLFSELGVNITRLKLAGLRCSLGHVYLLQGKFRAARQWYGGSGQLISELPRVLALYLFSLLQPGVVVGLIGLWRAVRKRLMLWNSS